MQKYKALITDLDGTAVKLASDGSEVSQNAKAAIQVAKEKGYKIACATGRRWDSTKQIVNNLGITELCVIEGGTRIIDPKTEKTVWEKHLDLKTLADVLAIFKEEVAEGLVSTLQFSKKSLHEVNELGEDSRYLYILAITPEDAANICNAVNAHGAAVAHQTPSWFGNGKYDVHVTHPQATKQHAIQVWQELEGVTKAETIGMGDGGNDLPLFLAAGLKVAVGNASDELKALADYIAPRENEDALAHVIARFLT